MFWELGVGCVGLGHSESIHSPIEAAGVGLLANFTITLHYQGYHHGGNMAIAEMTLVLS